MKAILLAAGYGTRMYPLTINCAKALLPLGKKKVLDLILEKIPAKYFDEIIIVSNNKFFSDFNSWAKKTKIKIKISVINDGTNSPNEALGCPKDLALALKKIVELNDAGEDFLVLSGDNIFGFDLSKMVLQFKNNPCFPLIAVTDTKDYEKVKKHGVVTLKRNEVISFEEKPQKPKSTIKSIFCYLFPASMSKELIDFADSSQNQNLMEGVCSKKKVFAFTFEEPCLDIGSKEDYLSALKEFGEKK
jgi:glucose-1-phosphate thymidylyltransferase